VGVGGRGRRLLRRVGLEAVIRGQIRGRRRGSGLGPSPPPRGRSSCARAAGGHGSCAVCIHTAR